VNEIESLFVDIFHEAKLAEDAPATVKTSMHRVRMYLHVWTKTADQRALAVQTRNVNRKPRSIQSVGGINKLPFRAANIKIVDELQDPYAI